MALRRIRERLQQENQTLAAALESERKRNIALRHIISQIAMAIGMAHLIETETWEVDQE